MIECPRCQSAIPDDSKFCNACGSKIEIICPKCGKINSFDNKYCKECGNSLLNQVEEPNQEATEIETISPEPEPAKPDLIDMNTYPEGERKYATILFSDLSGYTAMSEKLDPEELKDIMGRIFGEIAKVVARYEGHIDKFIGDAVMALFGVPKSHEDDAVRAILAAREIHAIVQKISPTVETKIGRTLTMHTGINTGLVVTGKMDIEKGVLGVIGDTVNMASRIQGLAGAGEILVGQGTWSQAGDNFTFENLEPTKVKGKKNPIRVYRVLETKVQPSKIQRLHGVRAKLIGRKIVFSRLKEIIDSLEHGKGAIISLSGNAGTGKSRLIEELKINLKSKNIQWLEGHAYPYAQNISYFPLINLLNPSF